MDKVTIREDGSIDYLHDNRLMNQIYNGVWLTREPEYDKVKVPVLAIVPDGSYHPGVPPDASDDCAGWEIDTGKNDPYPGFVKEQRYFARWPRPR